MGSIEKDRKSWRLKGQDYRAAGAYFFTVCTQDRLTLFGEVVDGEMMANSAGVMIQKVWESMGERFPAMALDAFVVMPNHLHGIVVIEKVTDASLVDFMRVFKSLTTVAYIAGVKTSGFAPFPGKLWQRSFHEALLPTETDLAKVRQYVRSNPANWAEDQEHPHFAPQIPSNS